MFFKKLGNGLGQPRVITLHCHGRGQTVEAQDVGQHAPERGAQQVAPLRKDTGQAAAAPLELPATRQLRLHRERHLGQRGCDAQLGEELHQQRVGALVVDQEAGVDAVRDAVERDVDGVGVPAEMTATLEEADAPAPALQLLGGGEAGDAGADDGDAFHVGHLLDGEGPEVCGLCAGESHDLDWVYAS